MSRTIDIPWLCDRHSHVSVYAALRNCPNLSGLDGAEAMARLRALPGDRVTTVMGWHSSRVKLEPSDLAILPPALLINFSMHGFALTDGARRLLAGEHPELVAKVDDLDWCERNLSRLFIFYGCLAGLAPAALDGFMTGLEQVGVGAVEDMLLTGAEALKVIRESPWAGRIRCWTTPAIYRDLAPADQEAITGLKLFTDGALGARSAALEGAFLEGGQGLLIYAEPDLERLLADLQPLGKPLAIHAIGGRAIEQVLTVLEHLAAQNLSFPWVRLEHVQFITPPQARRAKSLGVILSMQPNFNSDSVDYADRLAVKDLEVNNPFRMLIDQAGFRCGEDLILGSDGMPHGLEYALQWALFPPYPGQRLTLDELTAGYGLAPEGRGHATLVVDEDRRKVRLVRSEGSAPRAGAGL
jgi:predicted amidohydrolase YtcJ